MESGHAAPAVLPARESRYRALAVALIFALPIAYLPRYLGASLPTPEPAKPRWADLIVITVSEWPANSSTLEPELEHFKRRAAHVERTYSASLDPNAAAASLWTGRFPMGHGVRSAEQTVPTNSWTLASAARESGFRTAAFSTEPLIANTHLAGFDQVIETASLGVFDMSQRALEFMRASADDRVCIWLHLRRPTLAEIAQLLAELRVAGELTDRRFRALTVLTGFSRPDALGSDARARVPLWIEFPGGTSAGLAGSGSVSLVDLAGTLCEILTLPLPGPDQPALHSRGEHLWRNLGGGGGFQWLFVESETGDVLRFGRTRVAPDASGRPIAEQTDDPGSDTGFYPAPTDLAPLMRAQYEQLVQQLSE